MSTRCVIATKTEIGFRSIYCHHDGYLDGVGRTLASHFTTQGKVDELLALGDISGLGASIMCNDGTEAYSRDRGEPMKGVAPLDHVLLSSLRISAKKSDAEYLYVFVDGVWSWLDPRKADLTLQEVPK